jgi:hypothetical protein
VELVPKICPHLSVTLCETRYQTLNKVAAWVGKENEAEQNTKILDETEKRMRLVKNNNDKNMDKGEPVTGVP